MPEVVVDGTGDRITRDGTEGMDEKSTRCDAMHDGDGDGEETAGEFEAADSATGSATFSN